MATDTQEHRHYRVSLKALPDGPATAFLNQIGNDLKARLVKHSVVDEGNIILPGEDGLSPLHVTIGLSSTGQNKYTETALRGHLNNLTQALSGSSMMNGFNLSSEGTFRLTENGYIIFELESVDAFNRAVATYQANLSNEHFELNKHYRAGTNIRPHITLCKIKGLSRDPDNDNPQLRTAINNVINSEEFAYRDTSLSFNKLVLEGTYTVSGQKHKIDLLSPVSGVTLSPIGSNTQANNASPSNGGAAPVARNLLTPFQRVFTRLSVGGASISNKAFKSALERSYQANFQNNSSVIYKPIVNTTMPHTLKEVQVFAKTTRGSKTQVATIKDDYVESGSLPSDTTARTLHIKHSCNIAARVIPGVIHINGDAMVKKADIIAAANNLLTAGRRFTYHPTLIQQLATAEGKTQAQIKADLPPSSPASTNSYFSSSNGRSNHSNHPGSQGQERDGSRNAPNDPSDNSSAEQRRNTTTTASC